LAKRSHIKGATRALRVTQKKSVFDYQTNDYVHPKDADYPTKTARQTLRRFWHTPFARKRSMHTFARLATQNDLRSKKEWGNEPTK
jgi:hypothetical protein